MPSALWGNSFPWGHFGQRGRETTSPATRSVGGKRKNETMKTKQRDRRKPVHRITRGKVEVAISSKKDFLLLPSLRRRPNSPTSSLRPGRALPSGTARRCP